MICQDLHQAGLEPEKEKKGREKGKERDMERAMEKGKERDVDVSNLSNS
jgi:hypothetical protein